MQLVRAAFERVAQVGFEGLRLRQVAEDAGIDHSTLHHYFATKQDLIGAVAEYATRQFWVLGESVPDDPVDAMRAHLTGLRRMIEDWPELLVVTVELDLRARRDATVARSAGPSAGRLAGGPGGDAGRRQRQRCVVYGYRRRRRAGDLPW